MTKKIYTNPESYEKDLYEKLEEFINVEKRTPGNILNIKDVTQSIHKHITYLMGKQFLDSLNLSDDNFKYEAMCNNGFDIEIHAKDGVGKNIVAEIKGNMPVNGDSYGSAQKTSIKNDISYLINGKKKNTNYTTKESLEGVYRFLILLADNENAINNLITSLTKQDTGNSVSFKIWKEPLEQYSLEDFEPKIINVVFVTL